LAPLIDDLPIYIFHEFHSYVNYQKGSQIHPNTFGGLEVLCCNSAGQTVAAIMWNRSKAPDEKRDVTRDDS
jgi:hypothetical protein